jgi:signal transduction histidine kinase
MHTPRMNTFFARLRNASLTFPLAFVAALGLLLISEYSYNRSMESMRTLDRVAAMRLSVQTLLRDVLNAETGQRGYLLTGSEEYLHPYDEAVHNIGRTVDELTAFYTSHATDSAEYGVLTAAVAQKMSEMALTVQLRREGRDEAWRAIIETDIGREQMANIRIIAERLVRHETARMKTEHAQVEQTLMLSRVGIAAMAVLSLLAMALYLRQSDALGRERALREEALQTERDTLEKQVSDRTRGLAELANHLQSVREDERSHLARELHDELGALLTTAKLDVARIKSRLKDQSPEANERIAHLNETLNSVIALKRRIIEDLRPSSLSNLGLVAALEILVREFSERSDIRVHGVFEKARLTPSGELTVYRLVQEALTNAAKYAQANEIRVELRALPQYVEISVRDDGVGFDPQSTHPSAHGLLGMRYRVEGEGGRMRVHSRLGGGTQIIATLPLPPAVTEPSSGQASEAAGSGASSVADTAPRDSAAFAADPRMLPSRRAA